jgi:hypothetical protein
MNYLSTRDASKRVDQFIERAAENLGKYLQEQRGDKLCHFIVKLLLMAVDAYFAMSSSKSVVLKSATIRP